MNNYRPAMTRRNARKRGPIESQKYLNDTYERIVDVSMLYENTEDTRNKLDTSLSRIRQDSKDIHHNLSLIEARINRLKKEVT